MKNQILTSLISFGFAALLGSIPAAAQPRQTVSIPFTFEVAGAEYPAGDYLVRQLGSGGRVVVIANQANGHSAMLSVPVLSGKAPSENPKVVFTRTADHLKLSEVWFAGRPGMLTVPTDSKHELAAKVAIAMK